MVRWICKDWLLHVDMEQTKAYYNNFTLQLEEQMEPIWENYKAYCQQLSPKEQAFFDSFGITPECCNVSSFGINKKGMLSVWGQYRVKGTYEHIMEEVSIPVEEFVEQKLYLEKNQSKLHNGIHVGSYGITFLYPGSLFNPYPEDLKEGWIVFDFWIEQMPWLLDTPCPLKEYVPPQWWNLKRRYISGLESKKQNMKWRSDFIKQMEQRFLEYKIRFIPVEQRRVEPLKRHWFKCFVPQEKEQDAKKVCFSKKQHAQNYLWHLFSYEFADAKVGEEAILAFKEVAKGHAWVFTQFDNIAWKIDKVERLDLQCLDSDFMMWVYADFYIMAADGSWTYVHTHESDCGPYFYSTGTYTHKH